MSVIVFENPLRVNGRFINGFKIGIKLPKNPRKRIKVYKLHIDNLYVFLDFLLRIEPEYLKNFTRLNSKWFTELMVIMPDQIPDRMHGEIQLLASRVPVFQTKWKLLGYTKNPPLDLPF